MFFICCPDTQFEIIAGSVGLSAMNSLVRIDTLKYFKEPGGTLLAMIAKCELAMLSHALLQLLNKRAVHGVRADN